MNKRFQITDTLPPYSPQEQPEPSFRVSEPLSSRSGPAVNASHKLYLTAEAMTEIALHISWGEHTQQNRFEQGGILLGEVFRDSSQQLTYGVVRAAIPGKSATSSRSHLEMSHQTWKEMLDTVESLTALERYRNFQVIGWYHTHPNQLDVFMSGTDEDTQRRLFAHDWQFAVVLNPQREYWRAFHGVNARRCVGLVIDDSQQALTGQLLEKGSGQVLEARTNVPVEQDFPMPPALPGADSQPDSIARPDASEDSAETSTKAELSSGVESENRRNQTLLCFIVVMMFILSVFQGFSIGVQLFAGMMRRWAR